MDHPRLVHGVHTRHNLQHILLDEVEFATRKVLRKDDLGEVAICQWHHHHEAVQAYRHKLIITAAAGHHLIIDVSSS